MSEEQVHHIGDDQLVHGMPKRMVGVARLSSEKSVSDGQTKTYWRYRPKLHACDRCQAMQDLWFEAKPGPVHPNCKCEIEEFNAVKVTGRADAIIVPPGVDLEANLAEARRIRKICEPYIFVANPFSSAEFFLKCAWVFFNFKSGARYDYKRNGHPEYEDFGNYHYGLYTSALGLNATFTQAMAGFYQLRSRASGWKFKETWFDDPRDNEMIRKRQAAFKG
jgi:hypothetical protein